MARGRRPRRRVDDPVDDDVSDDEAYDDEPSGPPRPHRPRRGRRAPPVRAWREAEAADEGEGEDEGEGAAEGPSSWRHRPRRPVFFRARDSLYFEPLVALAIIVLLLVSLWAFTQNWPPMYIVESESMQHGSVDQVGLLNTGDLVLAQRASPSQITTYFEGLRSGYQTYGEYGDVILYYPNGATSNPLVIHRAIVFVQANSNGTYDIPDLVGYSCGPQGNATFDVLNRASGCGTTDLSGTVVLRHVGWHSADVSLDLASFGRVSGYVTLGDNNFDPTNASVALPDQPARSLPVDPAWVLGVARGMLPWFGALKLLLTGNAGEVPPQSWEWLGVTVVGFLLAAAGVHFALRAEGVEDERRKEMEAEEEAERGSEPPSRWRSLTHWRSGEEDDEPEDLEEPDSPRHRRGGSFFGSRPPASRSGGGRPRPAVRRTAHGESDAHRARRRRAARDESDDDL